MNVDFSIKGHHHHHPLQLHEDACLRGNDNELPEGFELTLIAILKLCLSGDYIIYVLPLEVAILLEKQ